MDQTEATEAPKKAGRPPNAAPAPKNETPVGSFTARRILAKSVQLGISADLLGSKMSLNSNMGNELIVDSLGILAISRKNGREVLVPWSNIRAVELFPGQGLNVK